MDTTYLDNPFLKAQEHALRITYIPKELRSIVIKESQPAGKRAKKVKKVARKKRR